MAGVVQREVGEVRIDHCELVEVGEVALVESLKVGQLLWVEAVEACQQIFSDAGHQELGHGVAIDAGRHSSMRSEHHQVVGVGH